MLCSHMSCFPKGERQYMSIQDTELDYQAGYTRILLYAEQARARGWRLTDRQLVYEILQRERAAQIREKSSLPMLGQGRCPANAFKRTTREATELTFLTTMVHFPLNFSP